MVKSKKAIKITAVLLSFVIVVVCCVTSGFTNWNTGIRFPSNKDTIIAIDGNGNELTSGNKYNLPQSMVFTSSAMSATAASSVTLTATVFPASTEYKVCDWSVVWQNPQSEWASGKSAENYISVTPTTDGALTADVSCIEPFGEKAIIQVGLRGIEDISAACIVDYRAKREYAITLGGQPFVHGGIVSGVGYYPELIVNARSVDTAGTLPHYGGNVTIRAYLDVEYMIANLGSQMRATFDTTSQYNDFLSIVRAYWGSQDRLFLSNVWDDDYTAPMDLSYETITILSALVTNVTGDLNALFALVVLTGTLNKIDPQDIMSLPRGFIVFDVKWGYFTNTQQTEYESYAEKYYYYYDTSSMVETEISLDVSAIEF